MRYKTIQEALDNLPQFESDSNWPGVIILKKDEFDQWRYDLEEVHNVLRRRSNPDIDPYAYEDVTFSRNGW